VHLIHFRRVCLCPEQYKHSASISEFSSSVSIRLGSSQVFGVSGWWLCSSHVHHEWMQHLRHLDRTVSSPETVFWRKTSSNL
jgi:hypothetical protein